MLTSLWFLKCSIVIVYNLDPLDIFFFLQKQHFLFHAQYPLKFRIGKKTTSKTCQSKSNHTKSRKLHVQTGKD